MATVAEQLRSAREARGLSIHQVADVTKMRTDHIRALEVGEYETFVAPVYIRGFVRTYAALLKLDVAAVMAELDRELGKTEKFSEPPSLGSEAPTALDQWMLRLSRINWKIALPVLTVGVLAAGTFWAIRAYQNQRAKDPLEGVGPGIYQPTTQTNSGDTLPLPAVTPSRRP